MYMEGKTNKRFDGLVQKLRDPLVRQQAGRFSALTSVFLILIALISNSVFPRTILGEAGSASATRLWSSGAELNTTSANYEVTSTSGTVSINGTTKRSGDFAYRANPTSSTGIFTKLFAGSNQSAKFWFRSYIRIADDPSADTYIMRVGNSGGGKISLRLTTTSTLQLRNEEDNANIGSASSALSTNTWYRVEIYVDTTTLSSTDAELRLDGVSVGSSTAENLASGIDRLSWGSMVSGTTDLYFDDIAINNSSGRAADNWPGEGKIVHMNPADSDGSNSAWSDTGGNGVDFDEVDEVTPDDETTYIYSQSLNITDVDLESSSSVGIGVNDKIKLASVGARAKSCGSGPGPSCFSGFGDPINYATRVIAGGDTDENNAEMNDSDFSWQTNSVTEPKLNVTTAYDLPGTSTAPWTASDLDSAEIGVRNLDSGGVGFGVSTLWLQVEYVERSGGRLVSSGFELNSATDGMEWTTSGGTPTIDATTFRSGAYALRTDASLEYARFQFESADTAGDYYARAYIRIASLPDGIATVMAFVDSSAVKRAYLRMGTGGALTLLDEDGSIGSVSGNLSTDVWYRLELRMNTVPSAGSHVVDGKIDGTSFASSSSRSISTNVSVISIGARAAGTEAGPLTSVDYYWDDVAVNKGIGASQNSFPGEGQIIHLRPSSDDSTNTAWTNGFANVDEVTPNDATDLVSETTSGDIDDYNIDDSSIGASDVVNLVSVGVRFNSSSATQEDFRVRLRDSTTGIAIESNNLSPASTTWTTNATAAPKLHPLTAYTRPEQDSVWLDAQLDTAQIGVRDVLSGTGTAQVTALWLLVDYSPPATISISGTCDLYDQTTDCNTDDGSNSIAVAVDGTLQGQSDATVDGAWNISGVTQPATGAIITVFINGESTASERAVAVTKYDGTSDISGVVLYHRHLTIGSADNQTLSNSDIDAYDNSVSGDADIFFDVSAGNDLTVDTSATYSDEELYIVTGNTYRPASAGGGDVNTTHLENDGTFQVDSNAINVFGNWQNDGTFTAGTSSVTMTSTTTGRTLAGTMTGASAFYDLTFSGSGGTWSFSAAAETDRDFIITTGAVTAPSGNLTIARNFTNETGFTHNSGTVILDTTTTATVSSGTAGTTFNNFQSTAATKTIQFEKHTTGTPVFTFTGTFTITGTSGNLINLYSDTSATQWKAHFNTAQTTVTYVNLRDGGCDTGTANVYMDATSTSVSNNDTCWVWPINRLWSGGAELQSATAEVETNFNDGTVFVDTTTKRSGGASWHTSNAPSAFNKYIVSSPTSGKYWFRVYLYIATAPASEIQIISLNGTAQRMTIRLNSDRSIELWDQDGSATQIGSASSALALNTWYRVEFFVDNTSVDSTDAELRLNGSTVASSTTIDQDGAFDRIQWGILTAVSSDLYYDDIAINGTSSAADNWPGDGKIVHMQPSDIGDNEQWTSVGTPADCNEAGDDNAKCVDEFPPDDDTSRVESTAAGNIDDYDVESATSAGIDSGATIKLVSVGARFLVCPSELCIPGGSDSYRARIKAAAAGTVDESAAITTDNSSYATNDDDTANLYPLTVYDKPGSASAWTPSDLDSAQIGIDHESNDQGYRVTIVWALVEFIPGNSAPDNPTALVQKKTTGGATLAVGDWTNETQVTFDATATDTDNPDTLQLCVEKDILGTSFSNTEDSCGTGVAYSGSGVAVTVTISSQTDASEYHWQARIKDAAGAYSSWVSYPISSPNAESARDYGIDTTACTYGGIAGQVYDGTVEDTDATYNDGSLTSLSANWDAFTCTVSGLNKYQYSIGTSAGGTQILGWTDNSTTESVTATSLVLRTNQKYYVNVRAVDNAANTSSVTSSNGQDVLPTISMSLSSNTLTFATLTGSNDRSDTKTITTTSSTNGYSGYVIRQYAAGLLTAGSFTIPMFSAGSYASPASWPAGACSGTTCGYGYTSNDTTIQGSNKFSSGTLYAPFATTAFGDIVADHTTNVDGSTGAVVNEQFTVTHKVAVDNLQAAQSYTTIVYYIITGLF